MRKILAIAIHEYWVGLRRPGYIFFTLLFPALGLVGLLVSLFFGRQVGSALARAIDEGTRGSAIVDRSGVFTPLLPRFRDAYRLFGEEEEARAALQAGELHRVVLVPSSYPARAEVEVVTEASAFSGSATSGLRAFFLAHLAQEIGDDQLRSRLIDPYAAEIEYVREGVGEVGGGPAQLLSLLLPIVLGFLLAASIFASSGYLLRSVSEEKSSRIIEIVLSSVTPPQLLAGKVLGQGALGLTQVIVWTCSLLGVGLVLAILAGAALTFRERPEVIVLVLVYFVLGYIVYAVFIGALGALGSNYQESQQLTWLVSMIAAAPLMLAGVILTDSNAGIARVLSWFPLTAPTAMMLRLPLGEAPWIDVAGSLIGLLATVPLVVWLGAKVFRLGTLLYGKRPGLAEIVRLLKEA